ncbi:MAG TPA: hypothetical protein VJH24_00920 [Candidatus Bilamarchaeaceae archaeon]|nr:hypothetical protein [Candidatus Bilamarchaeaceae archaeon]
MATLRMPDVRKLSKAEAEKKLQELENVMLELAGSGKMEKQRPIRRAIARLKTYLHQSKANA